jgi:hypothetical protein
MAARPVSAEHSACGMPVADNYDVNDNVTIVRKTRPLCMAATQNTGFMETTFEQDAKIHK